MCTEECLSVCCGCEAIPLECIHGKEKEGITTLSRMLGKREERRKSSKETKINTDERREEGKGKSR